MQFESDSRFDMDDGFSMCTQSPSCPSTTTSFSSASSAYEVFTLNTSRRSTPNELAFDLDGAFTSNQNLDIMPPSDLIQKYFPGPAKQEPESFNPSTKSECEQMGFDPLPLTSMKQTFDGLRSEYDIFPMNMPVQTSMGTITPSRSFDMTTISPEAAMGAQSYMMTPTRSPSGGTDMADSSASWSIPAESPMSCFQQPHELFFDEIANLETECHSQSRMGHYAMQHRGPPSPNSYRIQRKTMLHEAQHKTIELQRAQTRASRRRRAAAVASGEPEPNVGDVRRSMCKCDYPGCTKAFRRNEHLKRHKQTFHGEGPNSFCCEFCGKDQFNRQDNLNNHRKLHARPNSRRSGVEYIPEAVSVIEYEERSRKKKAPAKSHSVKAEADYGLRGV